MEFNVAPVSDALSASLRQKIDQKTKPIGALGALETLALQIGRIQDTHSPSLSNPTIAVFAADHGIAAEKVSAYPSEVTAQMVMNFLAGGAAINVFARQHGIALKIVDAGVNYQFDDNTNLIDAKLARGTRNYLQEPAMTSAQCQQGLDVGAGLVAEWYAEGCNVIGFGEMGIANTSAAALLTSILGGLPLADCVGAGTGVTGSDFDHKVQVLAQSRARLTLSDAEMREVPLSVLAEFGGFEIAMICGGMLRAAQARMLILVDGFISTSAFLVAHALCPAIQDYCVFTHYSAEQGHRVLLDKFGIRPLLDLGMRLGEGTGAAIAYPLVESAVTFLNEMSSFSDAEVSGRVDED